MKKARRVRARIVLLGDTFRPVVDKLDAGASPETVALASTMADVVHPGPDRIIRMAEVKRLTGLSRSTILRKANNPDDDFPSAKRLGESARGWQLWAVLDWLRARTRI